LEEHGILDIEPIKIKPSSDNIRVGVACIVKHLDCFFVSEDMMNLQARFKQFVVVGGDLDGLSVVMEMEKVGSKTLVPFKLILF